MKLTSLILALMCLGCAIAAQAQATLPQAWVDNNELVCGWLVAGCYPGSPALTTPYVAPTYSLTLSSGGGTWAPSPPSCTLNFNGQYFNNALGLQFALNDIDSCAYNSGGSPGPGIVLYVPPVSTDSGLGCDVGAYCSGTGIYFNQSAAAIEAAPSPKIVLSTKDSTLASLPMPVCTGGVVDNTPMSTLTANGGLQAKVDNDDCTGTNMHYDLGMQNVSGVITGRTQVSVNTVTLTAITSGASPQLVTLKNDYVSPVLAGSSGCIQIEPTTSPTQECVVPVSGQNQSGLYAIFLCRLQRHRS
jgi:hypothetical protein